MELVVEGEKESIDLGGFGLPPAPVRAAIEALNALQDGQLLTTNGLIARAGYTRDRFSHFSAHPLLIPFRGVDAKNRILWGNPKTVSYGKKNEKLK